MGKPPIENTKTGYERRSEIFAKDVLNLDDLAFLLDTTYTVASRKMSEMKRVVGDKLGVKGKILVDEYLQYFQIKNVDRYTKPTGTAGASNV